MKKPKPAPPVSAFLLSNELAAGPLRPADVMLKSRTDRRPPESP
jgi:hypothetical protein